MQKFQNRNTTRYKRTKYKRTKYKCNKIKCNKSQMEQNTKRTKCKNTKITNSILGVPIENQCVKGGGLLYAWWFPKYKYFVLLHFFVFVSWNFCILFYLYFVPFVFCCMCIYIWYWQTLSPKSKSDLGFSLETHFPTTPPGK